MTLGKRYPSEIHLEAHISWHVWHFDYHYVVFFYFATFLSLPNIAPISLHTGRSFSSPACTHIFLWPIVAVSYPFHRLLFDNEVSRFVRMVRSYQSIISGYPLVYYFFPPCTPGIMGQKNQFLSLLMVSTKHICWKVHKCISVTTTLLALELSVF